MAPYYFGGKGYGGQPEIRGPPENRVYVGNLAWDATWQDLKDHMRQAGDVAFADVMVEESGRSRGCGLVAYRSAADAERAVQELHDSELMGRKIFVREDRVAGRGAAGQDCRVYIGNLAWSVTWKDLKDHCRQAGEVTRADVLCEGGYEGGRSKGYGIVDFRTREEAQAAVEQLTDTELHGRRIFVREDRESSRPQQLPIGAVSWGGGYASSSSCQGGKGGYGGGFAKVFVGNLPFDVSWQDLKDHMRSVGDVVHVEVMTEGAEPGGRSKGCAVVEFATFGAAARAVAQLHDSYLGGRYILVREYYPPYEGESAATSYAAVGTSGKGKGAGEFRVRVGNLSPEVTWQVLKDHMRSAGSVVHADVTRSGGVVTFSSRADAKRAVEQLGGSTLRGQAITVEEDRRITGEGGGG